MKGPRLDLRGGRQGLIINWKRGGAEDLIAQLGPEFEEGPEFYRGARSCWTWEMWWNSWRFAFLA
jgi:hypothetical protein